MRVSFVQRGALAADADEEVPKRVQGRPRQGRSRVTNEFQRGGDPRKVPVQAQRR